jgi:hypothetical protein
MARFRRVISNPIAAGVKYIDVPVQEWQPMPALSNSWTVSAIGTGGNAQAVAGYWIDPWGILHLRGGLTGGTVTAGTTVCTFPTGLCPDFNADGTGGKMTFPAFESGGALRAWSIRADGTFTNVVACTAATNVFIDGITWRIRGRGVDERV